MRVVCSADTYTRSSHPNHTGHPLLTPWRVGRREAEHSPPPIGGRPKLNCNIDDNGDAYFRCSNRKEATSRSNRFRDVSGLKVFGREASHPGSCADLIKIVRNQCALKLTFSLSARASARVYEMKECCAAFYFCSLLVLTETERHRPEIFIATEDAMARGISRAPTRFRNFARYTPTYFRSINIIISFVSLGRSYFFQKQKTKKNMDLLKLHLNSLFRRETISDWISFA